MAKTFSDRFRSEELAKIHIGKKDLDLSDQVYRDIVWEVGRVESARDLDGRGRQAVLDRFRELGWKPRHSGRGPVKRPASRPLATDPQSRKIRALWIELSQAGAVRDSSEAGLGAFIKRLTGRDALQWLGPGQKSRVIESLKEWLERVQGQAKEEGS